MNLAAGVIVLKDDSILLVYEKGHWSLPKGKREKGESMQATALREASEETGFTVALKEVAFVTEFIKEKDRHYLQVYYEAEITGGKKEINDPDGEIEAVEFLPVKKLADYLSFTPRLEPLKQWLRERKTAYHFFDLS